MNELLASDAPRGLRRATTAALLGRIASAGSALLVGALLARLLSPSELGTYFLCLSLATFGSLFGGLGLHQTVQLLVGISLGRGEAHRARHLVGTVLRIGAAGLVATATTYLVLGSTFADLFADQRLSALALATAAWIVALGAQTILAETFRALGNIPVASVLAGAASGLLLTAVLAVWFATESELGLESAIFVSVGALAVPALIGAVRLHRDVHRLSERPGAWRGEHRLVLRETWSLVPTVVIAFSMGAIPTWIISAGAAADQVALFGAAARVAFAVGLPFGILTAIVPPIITRQWAMGNVGPLGSTLRACAGAVLFPVGALSIALVVLAGPVLALAYGEFYRSAAPLLVALVVGQFLNVLAGSCGEVLVMTGHQRLMMVIMVTSGIALVAGCALALQPWGVVGVAVTCTVVLGLQNLGMLLAARRVAGFWTLADPVAGFRMLRRRNQ